VSAIVVGCMYGLKLNGSGCRIELVVQLALQHIDKKSNQWSLSHRLQPLNSNFPILMTLNALEGHRPIVSIFKCDISHLRRVARSLCICRASYLTGIVIMLPVCVCHPPMFYRNGCTYRADYRAMHYSAKRGPACDRMSSVCLSVCLSVTLVDHDHIG